MPRDRAADDAARVDGKLYIIGLPPEPWPDIPDDYVFGSEWPEPPAQFIFSEADYVARKAGSIDSEVARILLKRLGVIFAAGTGTWEMPVRFIRAQVHAKLGAYEELIHSICLRAHVDTAPVAEADLVTCGTAVASAIHGFMVLPGYLSSSRVTGAAFWSQLVYDEVRMSFLEQTEGTGKDGKGGNLATLIDTIRVPIAPGAQGTQAQPLPLEVALCLTVGTDQIGPSVRGRTYLGGLGASMLGTDARFNQDAKDVGTAWGEQVIAKIKQTTDWRYNIFSSRHASSREAQSVWVGLVPDSQRSRRWKQPENRTLMWGTAAG